MTNNNHKKGTAVSQEMHKHVRNQGGEGKQNETQRCCRGKGLCYCGKNLFKWKKTMWGSLTE